MKRNPFFLSVLGAAALGVLSGCSTFTSKEMATSVRQEVKSTTTALTAGNKRVVESKVVDSAYINGNIVDYVDPEKGSISMNVAAQPLFAVFQSLAEQAKYSATITSEVMATKPITVDLRNVTHEQALRDVASAAGYIAVFDHARKTVTLTETASFTFRLPSRLFSEISAAKFKMSNNPGSSGASGSATATTTDASIEGGSIKQGSKMLLEYIQKIAGPGAEVQILPEAGIITVRSKAQQLRRIHQALTDYARMSLTQVELEVSMMEVTLSDDMSSGIDWQKLLNVSGSPLTIALNTAGTVTNPAASVGYTSASVQAMVNLLEKNTNARTLARQRFPAFNNSLSMMFDGRKVPYVGKIEQSVAGQSGTTTSGGSFEYAMDGISTAVYTNVLDNNQVELTLLPVLSSIEGFEQAVIGGNTIRAPIQPLRQGHFPFIGKNGQTLVFGGGRYGRESMIATGLPGVSGTVLNKAIGGQNLAQTQKELVFLVNTKIIPMTKFEPLVRESL